MTCDRHSAFLHHWNWPPPYNWNIVESGLKHHQANKQTNKRQGVLWLHVPCKHKSTLTSCWKYSQVYCDFQNNLNLTYIWQIVSYCFMRIWSERQFPIHQFPSSITFIFSWKSYCHTLYIDKTLFVLWICILM
jgi:hypothetical protein